jgi:putative oxidoreductase
LRDEFIGEPCPDAARGVLDETIGGPVMTQRTGQIEDVHGSGIYPGSGPLPPGRAIVRSPAELGHPEVRRRARVSGHALETAALLAGRAIFGGYFLYNGINHLRNREMLAGYAQSKGVPAATAAVVGSGLLLIAGGASILSGAKPKLGAGLIGTFLLGVSPQMHAFWRDSEPQERMQNMTHFLKNLALLGGGLIAAAHPEPWPASIHVPDGAAPPAPRFT